MHYIIEFFFLSVLWNTFDCLNWSSLTLQIKSTFWRNFYYILLLECSNCYILIKTFLSILRPSNIHIVNSFSLSAFPSMVMDLYLHRVRWQVPKASFNFKRGIKFFLVNPMRKYFNPNLTGGGGGLKTHFTFFHRITPHSVMYFIFKIIIKLYFYI